MTIERLVEFSSNHPALVAAFVALLALLVAGELRRRISGVVDVTPGEATRMINSNNAITVDMRPAGEFTDGHIANALNVTSGANSAELDKYRNRPLIVYCNSGQKSVGMCNMLRKQGFAEVYNLRGGILAWRKSELPLTRN